MRLGVAGAGLASWLGAAFVPAPGSEPAALDLRCYDWTDEAPEAAGVTHSEDGRFVCQRQLGLLAVLDRAEASLVAAIDTRELPSWERAKPLSLLLGVWLAARGRWPLHAGAVAHGDRVCAIPGRRGVGKSTAALVCAGELAFLGDDSVALDALDRVHAVYATAALDGPHLRRLGLPSLPELGETEDGKRIVRVESDRTAARAALLLLPRVVGSGPCRLVPATARDAFITAAPSSVLRRPVPARELLARLRDLAERVPCAWLELGAAHTELPGLVRDALEERA